MNDCLTFKDFLSGVEPDCENYLSYRDYLSRNVSFTADQRRVFDSATERIRVGVVDTGASVCVRNGSYVNRICVGSHDVDRSIACDVSLDRCGGSSVVNFRGESKCCCGDAGRGCGVVGTDSDVATSTCMEGEVRDECTAESGDIGNRSSISENTILSVACGGASVRLADDQLGPNTLRNRKIRQEKKERKNRRKLQAANCGSGVIAPSSTRLDQIKKKKNWRDGDMSVDNANYSCDSRGISEFKGSQGFWNSCSSEIRQELIDSKAQMHIAENRRKRVAADLKYQQDQAALSAANSVPMLVSQMVAVSKLANQLVRTTKDDQVHGWAKTVADSLTKGVAESAISKSDSLPSLESVGYGDSALKSSDGDSVRSRRLLLYQAKVEEFDKLVEEDSFDTVNQEVAYKKKLDDEYADVLLSEREFFEKKMTDSVVNYYMSNGKGLQEIESAIVGMGLPPRDLHAEFYSEI